MLNMAVLQGSSSKSKRLSKSTHDMLAEIFKKIGSKENTKEVSMGGALHICLLYREELRPYASLGVNRKKYRERESLHVKVVDDE